MSVSQPEPAVGQSAPIRVRLRDGNLLLPAALAQRCFGAAETVAVRCLEACIEVFVVHDAIAGGRLLKRAAADGTRAVHVGDLLPAGLCDDGGGLLLTADWDAAAARLAVWLAGNNGLDTERNDHD